MIFPMSAFSLLIGLGATLGLWQVARSAPLNQAGRWVDSGLGVLVGMLIGARMAYVALHPAYYAAHPGEWVQLWLGGYTAWGAAAGGLLAAGIAAALLRRSFLLVLDGMAPLFPPLAILGWLGCTLAGCAYGPAMGPGSPQGGHEAWAWLALPVADESGQVATRFPLQIAAALLVLGYNWALAALLSRRAAPGRYAALVGLGLAGALFGVAALSAEPAPAWRGLSPDGWSAVAIAVVSVGVLILSFVKHH